MLSSLKKYSFRKFRESETKIHELNYLFWECTTRCNLNCLHCGSDCSKDSLHKDMPAHDFFQAIDTIKNIPQNFTVVFTGGEPLLRNDLELCGKELRKRGFKWSIVSNGHLYNKERHISLLNAGIGALTISLDGLKESHNWLRNNSHSFEKVINAIESLKVALILDSDYYCDLVNRDSDFDEIRKTVEYKKLVEGYCGIYF